MQPQNFKPSSTKYKKFPVCPICNTRHHKYDCCDDTEMNKLMRIKELAIQILNKSNAENPNKEVDKWECPLFQEMYDILIQKI